MIFHSKPWVIESDLSDLKRVLDSRMLAQGEETKAFEKALSRWYGIDDAAWLWPAAQPPSCLPLWP